MKFVFLLVLLVFSKSFAQTACLDIYAPKAEVTFKNGHNQGLQAVMKKIKEDDMAIREFVNALKYSQDQTAARTPEKLLEIIQVAQNYARIFGHVGAQSQGRMMTPRIEMVREDQRAQYAQNYQNSYAIFGAKVKDLAAEFQAWNSENPKEWNPQKAFDLLLEMNTLMGKFHNKF